MQCSKLKQGLNFFFVKLKGRVYQSGKKCEKYSRKEMYVLCGGSVVTLNERQTKVKVDVGTYSLIFAHQIYNAPKAQKRGLNDTAELLTIFFLQII